MGRASTKLSYVSHTFVSIVKSNYRIEIGIAQYIIPKGMKN